MTTTTERYTAEQIQLFLNYGESWIDNKSSGQIKDEILHQAAADATRLQSLEAENARLREALRDIQARALSGFALDTMRIDEIARNAIHKE